MTGGEPSAGPRPDGAVGAVGLWDGAAAQRFRAGAVGAFFLLGLPDGMFGVVWPAMRADLRLPIDALGWLLLGGTAGYLLSSGAAGAVLRRNRLGAVLVAGTGIQAVASASLGLGYGLASLLASCVFIGACAGMIDSALSAAVSLWSRHRLMNLLHASYGVGAAAAPLLVTAAISLWSWRLSYLCLGLGQLALACWWWRHRAPEAIRVARDVTGDEAQKAGDRRAIWLGLLAFFFASGVEITTASWAASYLEGRWLLHGSEVGLGVFCYWVTLAGSRAAAAMGRRLRPQPIALASVTVVLAASAAVWASPAAGFAVASLAVLGFGLGPLLPALTSLTPRRVGLRHAPGAIGWQLSSASLGASGCSAYAGLVLQHEGFSATGPLLTGFAFVLALLVVALHRAPVAAVPASLGGTS